MPRLWVVEFAVLMVAFALYSAYQQWSPSRAAPPALDGRPWAVSAELIAHHAGDQSGVRLVIGASGPCWVSATADDAVVIRQLLRQGEQVAADARTKLVLHLGAPEAVVYWLNGVRVERSVQPGNPLPSRLRKTTSTRSSRLPRTRPTRRRHRPAPVFAIPDLAAMLDVIRGAPREHHGDVSADRPGASCREFRRTRQFSAYAVAALRHRDSVFCRGGGPRLGCDTGSGSRRFSRKLTTRRRRGPTAARPG